MSDVKCATFSTLFQHASQLSVKQLRSWTNKEKYGSIAQRLADLQK